MTSDNRAAVFMMGLVVLGILGVGALPTGAHVGDGSVAAQASPTATPVGTATETPTPIGTATPVGTATETATPMGTATETPAGTPAGAQAEEANVTFDDQTTAGDTVTVQSATLPEGGFVVIHAVNGTMADNATLDEINESALGASLGASDYYESGTQESVSVTIEPSLGEDETLIAVAYRDTDGDQAFDWTIDEAYTVDGGLAADAANVTIEVGTPGGTATPAPGGTATPAPGGTATPMGTPTATPMGTPTATPVGTPTP